MNKSATFNHRRRLSQIARRRGVTVRGVSNWHELADRLAAYLGVERGQSGPRRFCYVTMEELGWIAPRPRRPAPGGWSRTFGVSWGPARGGERHICGK